MMTLDELIKQADNPTPEYIRELSRQVHGAQKKCVKHEYLITKPEEPNKRKYKCSNCGDTWWLFAKEKETSLPPPYIPDYTKPENFWPLMKESNIMLFYDSGYAVACNDVVRYFDVKGFYKDWHNERNYCAIRVDEGEHDLEIVGLLAYLKVKE